MPKSRRARQKRARTTAPTDASESKNHFPIMTTAEVAEYLPEVPRASVYKLAQNGKIPCQKVGRHWRFRREAVVKRLDNEATSNPAVLRSGAR